MKTLDNILITGGTGFIGGHLIEHLVDRGYRITVLSRSSPMTNAKHAQVCFVSSLDDLPETIWYGVINLAGEPLDKSRWSANQKALIIESRLSITSRVNDWIRKLPVPPKVYISGSAIGWYGHWDNECLDEESAHREGFSHQLCNAWEAQANQLGDVDCRICNARLGIVLGANGGSLPAMLLPAKLGLGGPMGNGDQWWSWIHVNDTVRCFEMLLENDLAEGVFNLTAPTPVTQSVFAKTLGNQLKRPSFMPLPGFMAKLMLGEFAEEVLLNGQRVFPKKLISSGFTFDYEDLSGALQDLLTVGG